MAAKTWRERVEALPAILPHQWNGPVYPREQVLALADQMDRERSRAISKARRKEAGDVLDSVVAGLAKHAANYSTPEALRAGFATIAQVWRDAAAWATRAKSDWLEGDFSAKHDPHVDGQVINDGKGG